MKTVTLALVYRNLTAFRQQLDVLPRLPGLSGVILFHRGELTEEEQRALTLFVRRGLVADSDREGAPAPDVRVIPCEHPAAGAAVGRLLEMWTSAYLLLLLDTGIVELSERSLERLLAVAEDTGAGIVYADFLEQVDGRLQEHRLADYQEGSLRDTFDFGPLVLVSREAASAALAAGGPIVERWRWGGWYDLRLKISAQAPIVRVPECLSIRWPPLVASSDVGPSDRAGEPLFAYLAPENRAYEREMEEIATAHLGRIGAYLEPRFSPIPPLEGDFPVLASVVIPVRNRARTIAEAVRSALGQRTSFPYNVIVVDNFSTDGTSEILHRWEREDDRLIYRRPSRRDLGIGGCWNEALFSPECGVFAVQLDSDDLYADADVLQKIIAAFYEPEAPPASPATARGRSPRYAVVIGSYRTVNFQGDPIPPGLVDHREWTPDNGRNNALRVAGWGAPRAFYVPLLRRIGFPNVSYGEDYAVCLRLSREYEIGRIYEPLLLVRRWEDNTDRRLTPEQALRYEGYKDWLRTVEIAARRRLRKEARPLSS
jgi:glycosyltransferase involved in cell wall biosynthesis